MSIIYYLMAIHQNARKCNMFPIHDALWLFLLLLIFKSELTSIILNTVRPFAKQADKKQQKKQVFLCLPWSRANRTTQLIVHFKYASSFIWYFTSKRSGVEYWNCSHFFGRIEWIFNWNCCSTQVDRIRKKNME